MSKEKEPSVERRPAGLSEIASYTHQTNPELEYETLEHLIPQHLAAVGQLHAYAGTLDQSQADQLGNHVAIDCIQLDATVLMEMVIRLQE